MSNKCIPFLFMIVVGCKSEIPITSIGSAPANDNNEELIFHSGFEGESKVIPKNNDADIIGVDNSVPAPNDWVNHLDNHPDIGNFNVQYQGGDSTQRYARIIPEPGKPANKVLQFWLNAPNVDNSKGRIQGNLYGNKGMKEFYQSVRVFLHNDFNTVRTFPNKIHWLTLVEFWNNITWSPTVPNRFRITLGIGKSTEKESDLYFILDAQDCELFENGRQRYTTIWAETNEKVKVPIGKWFRMDYYYKEGNNQTGRFYLSITPDNEKTITVLDVNKITHNTQDTNPDGVTDFNPIKLYTSKELILYMQSQNKPLQIYWDDFKLWKNKKP